jgi:hypothetical protein
VTGVRAGSGSVSAGVLYPDRSDELWFFNYLGRSKNLSSISESPRTCGDGVRGGPGRAMTRLMPVRRKCSRRLRSPESGATMSMETAATLSDWRGESR